MGFLDTVASLAFGAEELPRDFDKIIRENCSGIPIEFMKAVARHESDFRPRLKSKVSSATGLFQVVNVVRESYNAHHGTSFRQEQLVDPAICTRMACFQFRRIAESYSKNHPETLLRDFSSRRWVEILAIGWNAGHSEAAGVGFLASRLEAKGYSKEQITLDALHAEALRQSSKRGRFLRIPRRIKFARDIAETYIRESGLVKLLT